MQGSVLLNTSSSSVRRRYRENPTQAVKRTSVVGQHSEKGQHGHGRPATFCSSVWYGQHTNTEENVDRVEQSLKTGRLSLVM